MRTSLTHQLFVPALLSLFGACAPDAPEPPSGVGPWIVAQRSSFDGPQFSDWPAPVNLGPPVNSALAEQAPAISKDGLSLYFHCIDCPGGFGGLDLWVSQRASVDEPWGPPQNLGPTINTSSNEGTPSLSRDGHALFFNSNRPGGFGGNDVYVALRDDKRDDLGWQPPVNLGSGVNTPANEGAPEAFKEHGTTVLYFNSNRPGGPGLLDIYMSTLEADGTFGPAQLVTELSTPFNDQGPAIRRDGLEMFLASDRPGSVGQIDLWVSTRAHGSDPWSPPINLGAGVNHPFIDAGPELSFDGTTLYFHSAVRPENVGGPAFDIWVATREKLRGGDVVDNDRDDGDQSRGSPRRH